MAISQQESTGTHIRGQPPYWHVPVMTSLDAPNSSDRRRQMPVGSTMPIIIPTPKGTLRVMMDIEMEDIPPLPPDKHERKVAAGIPPFKHTSRNNVSRQERIPSILATVPKAPEATLGKEKATHRRPTIVKKMAELRTKIKLLSTPIRLILGAKPFDVEEYLRMIMVHSIPITDLVACSPVIWRIRGRNLKTVPQEKRIYSLQRQAALRSITWILLLYDSERRNSKSRKLEARWRGPYWIQALLTGGAYRLNELKDGKLQLHQGGRSVNHPRSA